MQLRHIIVYKYMQLELKSENIGMAYHSYSVLYSVSWPSIYLCLTLNTIFSVDIYCGWKDSRKMFYRVFGHSKRWASILYHLWYLVSHA